MDLKSNQKVIGYFHDIHATITSLGIFYQGSSCSSGFKSYVRLMTISRLINIYKIIQTAYFFLCKFWHILFQGVYPFHFGCQIWGHRIVYKHYFLMLLRVYNNNSCSLSDSFSCILARDQLILLIFSKNKLFILLVSCSHL